MGAIRGHDDHLPGGDPVDLAVDGNVGDAVHDLDKGIIGGRVLAEPLAFVKGEQGDGADLFVDESAAHDRAGLVLGQLGHADGASRECFVSCAHHILPCFVVVWVQYAVSGANRH